MGPQSATNDERTKKLSGRGVVNADVNFLATGGQESGLLQSLLDFRGDASLYAFSEEGSTSGCFKTVR